jgi:guanylate kinase
LSRSWTTRARRPGEPADAYVFVDPETFRAEVDRGGFLEWARFLGNMYGTPMPAPPPGHDVILEIDVQGAAQVRAVRPDAVVVLVLAPSRQAQEERLRARGEAPDVVARRVSMGEAEVRAAQGLASHVVVNDDLERATQELVGIVESYHTRGAGPPSPPQTPSPPRTRTDA